MFFFPNFVCEVLWVTLPNKFQFLEVSLEHRNGSPALTGKILVGMLPHTNLLPEQQHLVASGQKVLPLTGVADLEPGDLVGVADAPRLRVPLSALQHHNHSAGSSLS